MANKDIMNITISELLENANKLDAMSFKVTVKKTEGEKITTLWAIIVIADPEVNDRILDVIEKEEYEIRREGVI